MEQSYVNWILGLTSGLIGFLLNSVWQAVRDLQSADKALVKEVGEIRVLVAGDYVRKEDFTANIAAIFVKLDRIEDKIDKKVDK